MSNNKEASPKKRADILDAALNLGLKYGFEGISVEAIAREARAAKPTVYKYFPNKEAIYQGVVERLIEAMKTSFDKALSQPGSIHARICAALQAKHTEVSKFLADSPHADELYSVHNRYAGAQFKALETYLETRLETELTLEQMQNPKLTAQLLITSAQAMTALRLDYQSLAWGIERLVDGMLNLPSPSLE